MSEPSPNMSVTPDATSDLDLLDLEAERLASLLLDTATPAGADAAQEPDDADAESSALDTAAPADGAAAAPAEIESAPDSGRVVIDLGLPAAGTIPAADDAEQTRRILFPRSTVESSADADDLVRPKLTLAALATAPEIAERPRVLFDVERTEAVERPRLELGVPAEGAGAVTFQPAEEADDDRRAMLAALLAIAAVLVLAIVLVSRMLSGSDTSRIDATPSTLLVTTTVTSEAPTTEAPQTTAAPATTAAPTTEATTTTAAPATEAPRRPATTVRRAPATAAPTTATPTTAAPETTEAPATTAAPATTEDNSPVPTWATTAPPATEAPAEPAAEN